MVALINLAVIVGLIALGFFVGRYRERAHLASLDRREAELADITVVTLQRLPSDIAVSAGAMVSGTAVIGADYFKGFAAKLRSLVGGEVASYATLVDRARREAKVRMLEEARGHGHNLVVNVRFQWSDITPRLPSAEALCLATSMHMQPADTVIDT